jgi:hypothetical protein
MPCALCGSRDHSRSACPWAGHLSGLRERSPAPPPTPKVAALLRDYRKDAR